MTQDLFASLPPDKRTEPIADGAVLLHAFAFDETEVLLSCVQALTDTAPFRHLHTPGGRRMSVAMSNCGTAGWTSDARGYRYARCDPQSGLPWPDMPGTFLRLAQSAALAAGYAGFTPDACLINRYEPGARMALHQDRDERDLAAPIVSVSLGLPATFLFGGLRRADKPTRHRLAHGDVVVWGGAARLAFHGVAPLANGHHPACGALRYNLTFRKAL